MKKTAIVNGKARRIEFSYAVGETISLSNTEVKKPWGRVTERVTVSKLTFTINGKTYEALELILSQNIIKLQTTDNQV